MRKSPVPNSYAYPSLSPFRKTEEIKWIGSPKFDGRHAKSNVHQRNRSNVSQITECMQWNDTAEQKELSRHIVRRVDKNSSHFNIFGDLHNAEG